MKTGFDLPPNGLAFSRRERDVDHLQKATDLLRAAVGFSAELCGAATGGSVTVDTHHSDHSATRADVPTSERIGNVTRSGLAR